MKRSQLFSVLFITVVLSACSIGTLQDQKNKDSFYSDLGGDAMRIPLIKPYEMLKLNQQLEINRKLGWGIQLHLSPSEKELYYYNAIYDIQKIAIENGIIMVYSIYPQEVDADAGQKVLYWFVIIPDKKIETGFDTEAEFLSYLQSHGIEQPQWLRPDKAYEQFYETGCLNWIPDCK